MHMKYDVLRSYTGQ